MYIPMCIVCGEWEVGTFEGFGDHTCSGNCQDILKFELEMDPDEYDGMFNDSDDDVLVGWDTEDYKGVYTGSYDDE